MRNSPLNRALRGHIRRPKTLTSSLGRTVYFPFAGVTVIVTSQHSATDVFSEDASVLILINKMLVKSGLKLILPGVSANSNDPICAVRPFAILE